MRYLIILILFTSCREYSCEGCYTATPLDTIYNDLKSNYKIEVKKNTRASYIYPQVETKFHPGHYWIFDRISIDTKIDSIYSGVYNLKNYLPMDSFYKGDKFIIRYELRTIGISNQYFNIDTLLY